MIFVTGCQSATALCAKQLSYVCRVHLNPPENIPPSKYIQLGFCGCKMRHIQGPVYGGVQYRGGYQSLIHELGNEFPPHKKGALKEGKSFKKGLVPMAFPAIHPQGPEKNPFTKKLKVRRCVWKRRVFDERFCVKRFPKNKIKLNSKNAVLTK